MSDIIDIGNGLMARVRLALRKHFEGDERSVERTLQGYVATMENRGAFVTSELEEALPPNMTWLLEYLDLDTIARDWEWSSRCLFVDDKHDVHVFMEREDAPLSPADVR